MANRLSVLLVEDSDAVRSRLTLMLESDRVLLIPVATVAAAIAALDSKPDLLSVDLNLPDGSGMEVIRKAKAQIDPPLVFVLTAVPEMSEACLRSGADRVFDKATQLTHYLDAIEQQKQLR